MTESGRDWIVRLGLAPHPEGGYFTRIHTSGAMTDTPAGNRSAVTSIHYLLTREQPLGRMHRNRSDILHYLQHGGPVEYLLLDGEGRLRREVLGYGADQSLFLLVPGGVWKASRLTGGADCVLVSEAVVPGFDYADHEFATAELLKKFPGHSTTLAPFVAAANLEG